MHRMMLLLGISSLFVLASMGKGHVRFEKELCDGWRFQRAEDGKTDWSDPSLNDREWQCVTVPHDWAIYGPFNPEAGGGSGKLPWQGFGWYRLVLPLSKETAGQTVYLDFEGVMASPTVYVNGQRAGGWDYGYMGFRVNATPFVHPGEDNYIAVKVDTTHHASRWYPGAGIYRRAVLCVCPPVHVPGRSTFVTTTMTAGKDAAAVRIRSAVTNTLPQQAAAQATLILRTAKDGQPVAQKALSLRIPAKGTAEIDTSITLEHPLRWDVKSPNLYLLEIALDADGARDTEITRFGVREISYPLGDGFHLNGRRVQIQGVCLHADLGPLGMAFDKSAMRRELAILQDMGVNAVRTSHNCPAPGLLDLCDEMGIVVWNECFDKWDGTAGRRRDQNLEEYVSRNLREFVKRDRNHPCVIAWSMSNEISVSKKPGDNGMTRERCAGFRNVMRALDDTRPIGNGNCDGSDLNVFADLDTVGFNYGAQYRHVHKKFPKMTLFYTESASAISSYGYYGVPLPKDKTDYATNDFEVTSYDYNSAPWSDIPDIEFKRMEEDRYCCGDFVWTGFDYLGEPFPYLRYMTMKNMPERLLARSSYFGIVDLTGVPKDRFYLYRSLWNRDEPTVHLLPHWNWKGQEGKPVPVFVYTSGDSAELFLNGRSLGKKVKGEVPVRPHSLTDGVAVSASSIEAKNNNQPAHVLDNLRDTRWCASSSALPQWLQLNFQKPTTFQSVFISFETATENYAYDLQTSADGKTWETRISKKQGEKKCPSLVAPVTASFLRIVITAAKEGTWASIRDVYVYDRAGKEFNPYYDVCTRYRLCWMDVPYEPGEIRTVAYKDGKKIGEAARRTAGTPAAVRLTPETTTLQEGEIVYVHVEVVDEKGIPCPLAQDRVSFSIAGPGVIAAVGNGNARGLDSFTQTSSHPLYYGHASAVLRRVKGKSGDITLTVSGRGVTPASVSLK